MATLTQTTNLVATDTTSPIGVAQVDKDITINAAAPVNQTSKVFEVSGGTDAQIPVGSITVATGYFVEIVNNEDQTTGSDLKLSTATGGSFAASVFGRVRAGGIYQGYHTAAIYGKADSASLTVSTAIRCVEDTAP